MKFTARLSLLILANLSSATLAQAVTVFNVSVYSSAASFAAAVSGAATYGFNGISTVAAPLEQTAESAIAPELATGPQTVAGVTFNSSGIAFVLPASTANYGVQFFSGQSPNLLPSDVLMSFAGRYAIGITYGAYATTSGTPVTITLSTGNSYTQTLPTVAGTDTNFIGFVSSVPLTSITLKTVANVAAPPPYAYSLDIVNFTLATPVPEPGTSVLAGLGLVAVGWAARRRS